MLDALRHALEEDRTIAYALMFGSGGRGELRAARDVDLAVELVRGAPRVDRTLLARNVAVVRDAVARIRSVLPPRLYATAASPVLDDLEAFCCARGQGPLTVFTPSAPATPNRPERSGCAS